MAWGLLRSVKTFLVGYLALNPIVSARRNKESNFKGEIIETPVTSNLTLNVYQTLAEPYSFTDYHYDTSAIQLPSVAPKTLEEVDLAKNMVVYPFLSKKEQLLFKKNLKKIHLKNTHVFRQIDLFMEDFFTNSNKVDELILEKMAFLAAQHNYEPYFSWYARIQYQLNSSIAQAKIHRWITYLKCLNRDELADFLQNRSPTSVEGFNIEKEKLNTFSNFIMLDSESSSNSRIAEQNRFEVYSLWSQLNIRSHLDILKTTMPVNGKINTPIEIIFARYPAIAEHYLSLNKANLPSQMRSRLGLIAVQHNHRGLGEKLLGKVITLYHVEEALAHLFESFIKKYNNLNEKNIPWSFSQDSYTNFLKEFAFLVATAKSKNQYLYSQNWANILIRDYAPPQNKEALLSYKFFLYGLFKIDYFDFNEIAQTAFLKLNLPAIEMLTGSMNINQKGKIFDLYNEQDTETQKTFLMKLLENPSTSNVNFLAWLTMHYSYLIDLNRKDQVRHSFFDYAEKYVPRLLAYLPKQKKHCYIEIIALAGAGISALAIYFYWQRKQAAAPRPIVPPAPVIDSAEALRQQKLAQQAREQDIGLYLLRKILPSIKIENKPLDLETVPVRQYYLSESISTDLTDKLALHFITDHYTLTQELEFTLIQFTCSPLKSNNEKIRQNTENIVSADQSAA